MIIAIDTETTGLSPAHGDRVIEWAAVKIEEGRIVDQESMLINPGVRIPMSVQKIHGIRNQDLAGARSPETAWQEFFKFVGDAPLIAHNMQFDNRFIAAEMARLGLTLRNSTVCTLALSRKCYPNLPSYRLKDLVSKFQLERPSTVAFHRALNDAYCVASLWLHLQRRDHE
ncbi:MAG: 3'-5' exonuclease [Candidatus Marinimicrobia bacterium]|nr:3'-5' exonuclease [Candidatus Neomarinimicrobiota bacterium]MCF7851031.1 3'-5' exonuclease [Candidatus Neomarinimicrobiota bacterium]